MPRKNSPSVREKLRIRVESGCATETLEHFLRDPRSVRSVSAERIRAAASLLGIALGAPPANDNNTP